VYLILPLSFVSVQQVSGNVSEPSLFPLPFRGPWGRGGGPGDQTSAQSYGSEKQNDKQLPREST
jgi:hypothetical protein